MARKSKGCCLGCGVAILALALGGAWVATLLSPTPSAAAKYVRFERPTLLSRAMIVLEREGVVRSAWASSALARLVGKAGDIQPGTYQVKPGSDLRKTLSDLAKPVSRAVRIPEGWWIGRVAARLEREGVCKAEEYVAAAETVAMEMKLSSLEGRLFPDTYNFPPLAPVTELVRLQAKTFERKVAPTLPKGADVTRVLTVASMVELEAALDPERPKIAGVIENRVAREMPLEIDATVLYALQEWKQLPQGVVRTVKSPYNTYLNKGLPPGPIGSPGQKSVLAALNPERHGYLYYVARPNRSHYFASTYPDHLANIRKARKEWREAR